MRIPKAVLGGSLVLVLVAAGIYFFVLDKRPATPENQGVTAPPRPPVVRQPPLPTRKSRPPRCRSRSLRP